MFDYFFIFLLAKEIRRKSSIVRSLAFAFAVLILLFSYLSVQNRERNVYLAQVYHQEAFNAMEKRKYFCLLIYNLRTVWRAEVNRTC